MFESSYEINCWFTSPSIWHASPCTITKLKLATNVSAPTFKKMRRSASAESMTSPASDADFRLRRMANARSVGGMSNASNADEREALRGELRNATAEREAMATERAAIAAERAAMVADMQRIVEEAIRADRCAFSCELQTRLDSTTASLLATASSQASTIAKAEVQAATAMVSSHVMAQTGQTREPRGRNLRSAEFEAAKAELSQHASRATEATTQATAAAALAEQFGDDALEIHGPILCCGRAGPRPADAVATREGEGGCKRHRQRALMKRASLRSLVERASARDT
jgi:hypothetical protein